jgi:hypothetical protein
VGYVGLVAKEIPQRDFRNNNAKLMDAVTAGETFSVTAQRRARRRTSSSKGCSPYVYHSRGNYAVRPTPTVAA